jgi:hypothetical protein
MPAQAGGAVAAGASAGQQASRGADGREHAAAGRGAAGSGQGQGSRVARHPPGKEHDSFLPQGIHETVEPSSKR